MLNSEDNRRAVIISAADIHNYEKIRSFLNPEKDFYIICDAGLKHIPFLDIKPSLIVGDFDSAHKPETNVKTIVLPHEKDDTDTFYAVKEAVKMGFKSFLFIGTIGNRLDHSLANISALLYLDDLNLKAVMLDDYSEILIAGRNETFIEDSYSYFSLMNADGKACGVTIKNALYPLTDATLSPSFQLGVSNEVIKGKTASVTVKDGRLLLIKVW